DRDNKARRNEPQQGEDEHLPFPAREKFFEHGKRAVAVRAFFRNAAIHRQSTEQREQYKNESCERRESSDGKQSDSRLISEGREIVHTRQAHHLPPRMLRVAADVL